METSIREAALWENNPTVLQSQKDWLLCQSQLNQMIINLPESEKVLYELDYPTIPEAQNGDVWMQQLQQKEKDKFKAKQLAQLQIDWRYIFQLHC
jgi:hypothetical protein